LKDFKDFKDFKDPPARQVLHAGTRRAGGVLEVLEVPEVLETTPASRDFKDLKDFKDPSGRSRTIRAPPPYQKGP
jgi:hypothetical protein